MSTLKINNIQSVTNGPVNFPKGFTFNDEPFLIGDGSASFPSLSFVSNVNSGLYKISQNVIGLSTNGTERLRIDGSGNFTFSGGNLNFDNGAIFINGTTNHVGINTTNPTSPLDVIGNIKVSGIIHSGSGTVTSPSIAFTADNDTGLFRQSENSIGISASGTEILRINSGGIHVVNGTSTNPAIDFLSDTDTGLFRQGENSIGVAASGTEIVRINNNGISVINGTAANPSITFTNDTDTGIYRISENIIGISTNGIERLRINSTGSLILSNGFSPPNSMFFRNLVMNGDMNIYQRNITQSNITGGGFFTADRWVLDFGSLGTFTQSVESDAPSGTGANLRRSLKMLCTTAASESAGSLLKLRQTIEAQYCNILKKGSVNAEAITVSFWVKSNVIGTYTVELEDQTNNRVVCGTYTIVSSATWERKVIYLPADTVGALNNDSGVGMLISFHLGAGSNWKSGTLQTVWGANVTANRVSSSQINLASSINNYWQITGIQLEPGPIETPFENLPYDMSLIRCKRYYQKSYAPTVFPGTATQSGMIMGGTQFGSGVGGTWGAHMFPVEMRNTGGVGVSIWDGAGTANLLSYTYGGGGTTQSIFNGGAAWGDLVRLSSFRGFLLAATSTQPNSISYAHYVATNEP